MAAKSDHTSEAATPSDPVQIGRSDLPGQVSGLIASTQILASTPITQAIPLLAFPSHRLALPRPRMPTFKQQGALESGYACVSQS
ncbi:MAG: hypothetical protein L6R42_005939 [Xanthoria sp. 1 TBL-2021]|nr:MAG: hypothetical protein L6R42_005939 [Xanthoria sp. 1 TBL-2021]